MQLAFELKELREEVRSDLERYFEKNFKKCEFYSLDAVDEAWCKVENFICDVLDFIDDKNYRLEQSLEYDIKKVKEDE